MMKPFLHEISNEMKDKVVVIKIDADQNPELCKDLSIEALPTLFVYKKGTMMWHNVGYVPKEEVLKYLK
jgi:thioredoxin-like negative regulator of GroEL